MKNVLVLGTGCAKCRDTTELVRQVAAAKGVEISLEKVEDMAKIVGFGVMSTPAVVVDGKVVHAGGMPSRTQVESWL